MKPDGIEKGLTAGMTPTNERAREATPAIALG